MNKLTIRNFPAVNYAVQEAVNTLCTNITFSGSKVKKIVFTSTQAGEGKSYLAMNTMRTMAKLGKKVAFVDADLRRSNINSRFDLHFGMEQNNFGLAHYLAGMIDMENIIYSTNLKDVWMVPVGKVVSNPLGLLNSELFQQLLDHLAQNTDYVFVDAPPVGAVIDAAAIARSCDGVLIAVNYNSVSGRELAGVKGQLEQTGIPILGVVLNQVEMDDYMSKKYYYRRKYSYYSDISEIQREKKRPKYIHHK